MRKVLSNLEEVWHSRRNQATAYISSETQAMSEDSFRIPSTILPFHPNPQPPPPPVKKKRSLPGNPDPEAEVIALSPRSLMAPNRFVCEICNKGFQRDQNLQLHRRGHNLPWKLRQRTPGEPPARKRVYVCPEPSCVHHDPARALGDLTGIKKHFSRKHGEKKWKCDRCGKRYAVQSDHKAHSKTCGSREYRCDCGTLFSRKDSFVTHRAFCDALTQETAATAADTNPSNDPLSYVSDETPKEVHPLWRLNRQEMALPSPPSAYLSATALLQKAAQMGATTSGSSSSAIFSGLLRSTKGSWGGELGKGMTRDFLGLGGDAGASRNMQEMTNFASLGSGVEFMSTTSSYNAAGYN